MKNKLTVWLVIGAALFAVVTVGYVLHQQSREREPAVASNEPIAKSNSGTRDQKPKKDKIMNRQEFAEKYGEISPEEWERLKQMEEKIGPLSDEEWKLKPQEAPSWANWVLVVRGLQGNAEKNRPVRVFGKVVTEDGKGLPDVSISGFVEYAEPSLEKIVNEKMRNPQAQRKPFTQVSDANGEFQVIEDIGQSLYLQSFQKDGYVEIPGMRAGFNFFPGAAEDSKFMGNKQNPVVFKMRKVE